MPNYYYGDARVIRPGEPVAFMTKCSFCHRDFFIPVGRTSNKINPYRELCPECTEYFKKNLEEIEYDE